MAAALSLPNPIPRTKTFSLIVASVVGRFGARFIHKNDYSSSSTPCDSSIPLLQKLLKAPVSRIKATLDSEFEPEPLPEFLTSLNSSTPHKAHMVIEWKLENLTEENRKNRDSYAQLIALCGNIRNLPVAMSVFSSMEAEGIKASSSVFNALISTSLSSGNLLRAFSLFEIMEASEGYRPDSDTYSVFISAYAYMGKKGEAESWLSAKQAADFSVDARNYGSLIFCCAKCNDFEDAERYYQEMILSGVLPDESIFRNMIMMYCGRRDVDKVKEFLNCILNGGWRIDENMVKKIVRLYQELGSIEDLEELLVYLTESNQGLEILSVVYSSIVRIYADKDRLDDIEFTVGRMLKHGISFRCPEDVERVICSYFRREAYDRLDMFLECIKGSYKLTRSVYDLLGAGYRRAGLSKRLDLLVVEMKRDGLA